MPEKFFDFILCFISHHDLVILVQRDRKGSNLHNCPSPLWARAQTPNCLPPWPHPGASAGQLKGKKKKEKKVLKNAHSNN